MKIPFYKPYWENSISEEFSNIFLDQRWVDGFYSIACKDELRKLLHTDFVSLTSSCTSALEMAAILIKEARGGRTGEIIVPNYTFASTANAFATHGFIPVFVDIRPDTLNINEFLVDQAITKNTVGICVVHYAGLCANMQAIKRIAYDEKLWIIEDAAQAIMSEYQGFPAGSIGDLGAFSFHATKNLSCGEGGALAVNNEILQPQAEIISEKGTNRKKFLRGQIPYYSWAGLGGGYGMNEFSAAVLFWQIRHREKILGLRHSIWDFYHYCFSKELSLAKFTIPSIIPDCKHNAHIFYLIFARQDLRDLFILEMKNHGIQVESHYLPLHQSPAGRKYGLVRGDLDVSIEVSQTIARLPIWSGMDSLQATEVVETALSIIKSL